MPFVQRSGKDKYEEVTLLGQSGDLANVKYLDGTTGTVSLSRLVIEEPKFPVGTFVTTDAYYASSGTDMGRLRGKILETWRKGGTFRSKVSWQPWHIDSDKNHGIETILTDSLNESVWNPKFLVGEVLDYFGDYSLVQGHILTGYRISDFYNDIFILLDGQLRMKEDQAIRPGTPFDTPSYWGGIPGRDFKTGQSITQMITGETAYGQKMMDPHAYDLGHRDWVEVIPGYTELGVTVQYDSTAAAAGRTVGQSAQWEMEQSKQDESKATGGAIPQLKDGGQLTKLRNVVEMTGREHAADFPADDWDTYRVPGGQFDYKALESSGYYERTTTGMVWHEGRTIELQPMGQGLLPPDDFDVNQFPTMDEIRETVAMTDEGFVFFEAEAPVPEPEPVVVIEPEPAPVVAPRPVVRAAPKRFNFADFMKTDWSKNTPGRLYDYKSMDKSLRTPLLEPEPTFIEQLQPPPPEPEPVLIHRPGFAGRANRGNLSLRPNTQQYRARVPGEAIELTDISTIPERSGGRITTWDKTAASEDPVIQEIMEERAALEAPRLTEVAYRAFADGLGMVEDGVLMNAAALSEVMPNAVGIALYYGTMIYGVIDKAIQAGMAVEAAKQTLRNIWENEAVWVFIQVKKDPSEAFKYWKAICNKVNVVEKDNKIHIESWECTAILNKGITVDVTITDGTSIMIQGYPVRTPKYSRMFKYMYNAETLAGLQDKRAFDEYDNTIVAYKQMSDAIDEQVQDAIEEAAITADLARPPKKFEIAHWVSTPPVSTKTFVGEAEPRITTVPGKTGSIYNINWSEPYRQWVYTISDGSTWMESHLTSITAPENAFPEDDETLENTDPWYLESIAQEIGLETILKDCWTITFYQIDTTFTTKPSDILLTHPSGKCRLVIRPDTKQYFFFMQTDFPASLTSLGDIPVAKMYQKQNGDNLDDKRSATAITGQVVSAQ